ncbi:MAG TPA: NAD(P)-dependent alcohol dehydrogenase [Desulfosarcina sp.]|nr:NAD(P)-dependent alcohol dehydrogenase [Desulfosarcina sp.]
MIKAYAASEAGGRLTPYEYDPGPIGYNDVEIEVAHCGICHSDLSMLEDEWKIAEFPLVPGHEVVGTVRDAGPGVSHLRIGRKVGLGWHAGYCMTCPSCLGGDHNLCANAQGTIVKRHGGFADKVRAHSASVVALPDNIDAQSAGPLFCGGITVFNPLVQFAVKPTDRVAVIGIGGLGHMALQFLNAWGCRVTAFTSSDAKKKEALEMGAHQTLDSRDPDDIKAAEGHFDMILSTVNVKLAWNDYIRALKPRGRLHIVGAALEPLDLAAFPLIMGQRSISASPVGSPATIADMLDFSVRHGIKPVVEPYPMAQVNDALDRLKSGQARYRIVLNR